MNAHKVQLTQLPLRRGFRARCRCGWQLTKPRLFDAERFGIWHCGREERVA